MLKFIISAIACLSLLGVPAYAKTFDPHGELKYVEVTSSHSCGLLNKDEQYYKITNACDKDYIAIYRIIDDQTISIEIDTLKPKETKLYFRSYGLWYNLYDKETIDSMCGNGVSDFLLTPRLLFQGDRGDQLFYVKDYEQYFAITLDKNHLKFHCHVDNIEKASH